MMIILIILSILLYLIIGIGYYKTMQYTLCLESRTEVTPTVAVFLVCVLAYPLCLLIVGILEILPKRTKSNENDS